MHIPQQLPTAKGLVPVQSESEIRTDNFTTVLCTVPVIITSDITSHSWVVTWKLGFIGMNSLVGLFNSEACQSLGVIKREASGKALSGLVRRRRACFFTK
jgi:hypothetical protein